MTAIAELVDVTKAYFCLDCGVCTGSCPVARVFPDFSPRQIIERSLYDLEEPSDDTIWSCLTCAQCSVRCPAEINFPEFIRRFRDEAHRLGYNGVMAHNGMLQTITAIQTMDIRQNRTFWVEDGEGADGTFNDWTVRGEEAAKGRWLRRSEYRENRLAEPRYCDRDDGW